MGKTLSTLIEYPEIMVCWHPTKNGNIKPDNIAAWTKKKYWWLCPKGHEYEASCNDKKRGEGCPYCAGKKVCNDNSLGGLFPKIAARWHPTKNGELTPNDVCARSSKKYWWLGSCGHEWLQSPDIIIHNSKEGSKEGCPYCAGKRVCHDNCLETVCPQVASEWHPIKNGNITPKDIIAQTHKRYWWLCKNGHEWLAICKSRVRGTGCPFCNESRGEKRIVTYLQSKNYLFNRQARFDGCKHLKTLHFDFMVNDILIEYQGKQHYFPLGFGASKERAYKEFINIVRRDHKKEQWCKTNNTRLVLMPYWDYNRIEIILDECFTCKELTFSATPNIVKKYSNIRERIKCLQKVASISG